MLEWLPFIIGGGALGLAALAAFGFERFALSAVLFALGTGQIYLAVAALGVFLLIANGGKIRGAMTVGGYVWGLLLLAGILITTTIAPASSRTYVELAQLALYLLLLLLVLGYIDSGERLIGFLESSLIASVGAAGFGLLLVMAGQLSAPNVFVGRGANEGAVFLSLMGAVPAGVLFVKSRNPAYLLCAGLFIYMQDLATSRGSVAVTACVVLLSLFFVFRNRAIRAALIVLGLYVIFNYVPLFDGLYRSQLNFSARERLALLYYGLWLWQQKPFIGWGWGSTTDLAERTPTTELYYPHFHDTYVQFMVESGAVGILIIATFFYFCISRVTISLSIIRQPAVTMLASAVLIALTISGFFDALLYGADRAIQVIILISWSARAVVLAPRITDTRIPGFEKPEAAVVTVGS